MMVLGINSNQNAASFISIQMQANETGSSPSLVLIGAPGKFATPLLMGNSVEAKIVYIRTVIPPQLMDTARGPSLGRLSSKNLVAVMVKISLRNDRNMMLVLLREIDPKLNVSSLMQRRVIILPAMMIWIASKNNSPANEKL